MRISSGIFATAFAALIVLSGCSNEAPKTDEGRLVAAGEKAAVGHLTYTIVDEEILTHLGDEASPRVPKDRFIAVQIAVTNSSNVDNPIPAVQLISDSGQTYGELPDGSGLNNWMGMVRHVGPGQTERGMVLFDAPSAHYKVKFTDEHMDNEILADMPLSYAHEKVNESSVPTTEIPDMAPPVGKQTKQQ